MTRGATATVYVITARDREMLRALDTERWLTPRMVGGRAGSWHSDRLARLARHSLVERRKFHVMHCSIGMTMRRTLVDNRWVYSDGHPPSTRCTCKGHCRYRLTAAGAAAISKAQR